MKASRIDLLEQNSLLERAVAGVDLLEERLTNLLQELKRLAREISTSREELIDLDIDTMYSLGIAYSEEGELVEELSKITVDDVRINVQRERKYGIDLPEIAQSSVSPSKHKIQVPLTMSTAVATARDNFETLFFSYLNYVEQVIVLQRLGREIKKTRRQIMVLDHQIIPSVRENILRIKLSLAEQEREEQVRLRRVKKRKV